MLLRRLDTPESIAYWEGIDDATHECRTSRRFHINCRPSACRFGNGDESCDRVILNNLDRKHPDDHLVEAWELMTTGGAKIDG